MAHLDEVCRIFGSAALFKREGGWTKMKVVAPLECYIEDYELFNYSTLRVVLTVISRLIKDLMFVKARAMGLLNGEGWDKRACVLKHYDEFHKREGE